MNKVDGTEMPTTNSSFSFFEAKGFQYGHVGPLLAHGGFVFDQVEGTADRENPDNQTRQRAVRKVPPSWSQGDQGESPADTGDRTAVNYSVDLGRV